MKGIKIMVLPCSPRHIKRALAFMPCRCPKLTVFRTRCDANMGNKSLAATSESVTEVLSSGRHEFMAETVKVDEINSFATLLIQSDRFGSSIAETLRVYSDEMREKRRLRAEEKAHRIPVLISVPLVACMLPVMIGVLMLPAVIRVVREVLPSMAGG